MRATSFQLLPCEGTFFQLASYTNGSTKKDQEYAIELIKTKGVASIPLSSFYNQNSMQTVLRFCFAKTDQTLLNASLQLG
jgi:methionine aminotransferase